MVESVEKIILGIDPGTRILGYSVLEIVDGKPNVLVLDVLYLKQIADFNLRIRKIFDSTLRIIDSYHPDHLAIEAPFFGKNVQSMLKLGRAQGVAIAAAMSRDLSFSEYEPTTIKQTVTGNGLASKKQVEMMLRSLMQFPDEPRYLDATDALAVAYTCFVERSNPLADVREQLKVKAKRQTKSRRKAWADYVSQNPEIIDN
ncbi:MAG: crossover junction endodeoxyribonuclease RuvC [Bacteroidales bacterium]|nr:crossover junction endodeoxyribonuclease RuvC [Bacteroidales bacterium]MBR4715635.1 crossover junction endodeoxyribonuclease RuvC [Bacteroidales bacterium]MCR4930867.1 crossover junction endodeoxyribonuclease RuvC [Bacteroidales bacterium]